MAVASHRSPTPAVTGVTPTRSTGSAPLDGDSGRSRQDLAHEIVRSSLGLVALSGFREYFDPFDGTGRGSTDFSWSAALAIDLIRSSTA